MESKRKLHLDVLRIIAAYFVIFNHTPGFSLFTAHVPYSKSYWAFLTISVFAKISVPLFLMISGALLLPKDTEKPRKILIRFLRILIVLIVFSFLSYLQQIHLGAESFNLQSFFRVLIQSDWLNAYWYLYLYLAFLLCLPFLRTMVKNLQNHHYLYLFILYLVFNGIIPVVFCTILKWEFSINGNFSFGWLLSQVPLYPLIGHYLENKLSIDKVTWKNIIPLWLFNLLCIALTCYATYLDNETAGWFTQNYIMSFVLVPCITLYITAKKLLYRINTKLLSTILSSVGSCTFGIYLIHGQLLREPKARILQFIYNFGSINPMIFWLLVSLDVMLIAFGLIWLLRRIPYVKKLI